MNLKDDFFSKHCILCLDPLFDFLKEDLIVDLCPQKKHKAHRKCIEVNDNSSVFNNCIDCVKYINDYMKIPEIECN